MDSLGQTPSYLSSYGSAFGTVSAASSPSGAAAYGYGSAYNTAAAAQPFGTSQQVAAVRVSSATFISTIASFNAINYVSKGLEYGAYAPYGQAGGYQYYGHSYGPYGNGVPVSTTALPGLSPTNLAGAVSAAPNSSVSSSVNFPSTGTYQLPHTLTSTSSSLSGELVCCLL